MIELEDIYLRFHEIGYWEKYHSDITLTVNVLLTELTCPLAVIRFESPDRAGMDIIAQCYGDTIEQAIEKVIEEAFNTLKGDAK